MARRVAVICLAALCCTALAQVGEQNPLDPAGFPPNLPRDGRLPPPLSPEQGSYDLKILSSEEWTVEGNEVRGTKVEFEYRGYRVRANEALGDLDTDQFALRGEVNVLGQDYVVRGDYVFVDLRVRSFRFVQGEVDLRQSLLEGRVQTDVYVKAAEAAGTEALLRGTDVTVTTCEYPNPHYAIYSGDVEVEPGKKLTFRDFRLKILGKTVLRIPRVTIPLDRRTQGITPDFGHSQDEGYFVKTRIGTPAGKNTFYTRVDLMTRKGVGLGGELVLDNKNGRIGAYGNFFGNTGTGVTASGAYKTDVGKTAVEIEQSYRKSFFLTGIDTSLTQTRLRVAPRTAAGQTELTFYRDHSEAGGFDSTNLNARFHDRRTWSPGLTTSIELNYSDTIARQTNGKGVLSRREALEIRAQTNYDLRRFVARLDYQRIIPLTESFNFIGGIDRTPELTVLTDSSRIFGADKPSWMPHFSLLASAGAYHDRFNQLKVDRYFVDVRANHAGSTDRLWNLSYEAGLQQGFYSDNTALYTPRLNLNLRYGGMGKLRANLFYGYNKPHGFSPIQSDRTGTTNYFSADVTAELFPAFTAAAQVGFDFHQNSLGNEGWVSPALRFEYKPGESFKARLSGNYIPQLSSIGNIRFDLAWKHRETFVGVGLRWDGVRDSWGNLNLFVDALTIGRLRLSALLLYNGYLEKFDARHFSLTWDMHCTEAVLQILESKSGFRPGREIVFFVRIKGLPFNTPFGIGGQGQPLGYGTGGG